MCIIKINDLLWLKKAAEDEGESEIMGDDGNDTVFEPDLHGPQTALTAQRTVPDPSTVQVAWERVSQLFLMYPSYVL